MPNFLSQIKLPNNETYNFHDIEFIEDTRSATGSTITGSTTASALYDGKTITISTKYGGQADLQLNLTLSGGTTTGAKYIYTMQGEKLGAQIAAGSIITLMYRSSYSFYKLGASEATTITDAWWMLNTGGTAGHATAIPFAAVDSTSTSTVYTATVPGVTALYDGVCVYLKNGVVTSAANFTININGLGAKPVYTTMAAATRATTVFNINYTMLFVYNSSRVTNGCWDIFYGYNANDNTVAYNIRDYQTNHIMNSALYRYMFVFTKRDKKLAPSCGTSNSTSTSKTLTTVAFDPTLPIYYYSTTTTVAANKNPAPGSMWMKYSACNMRYAFNVSSTALTSKQPVYLRCVDQGDGTLKLDGNNCVVQTLPTSADNKVYLYLGHAYSAYQVELQDKHPCLIYSSTIGGMVPWYGISTSVDLTGYAPLASPAFTGTPTIGGYNVLTTQDLTKVMHFRGVSSTAITDGGNETATISGNSLTAQEGDVIIYNNVEFIWNGSVWEQLGDEYKLPIVIDIDENDSIITVDGIKGYANNSGYTCTFLAQAFNKVPIYINFINTQNKKQIIRLQSYTPNVTLDTYTGDLYKGFYTETSDGLFIEEFNFVILNDNSLLATNISSSLAVPFADSAGNADYADYAFNAGSAVGAQIMTTTSGIAIYTNSDGTFGDSGVTIDSNQNISTSGKITIGITPTATMEVANKGYVDSVLPTSIVVYVTDFNATGDGTTNDATNIQNAIDSVKTTGGTIVFPKGTYKINTSLKFYSNQTFLFENGATLLQGAEIDNLLRNDAELTDTGYTATNNVRIIGATFDGGSTYTTMNTLLAFTHAKDITIQNCYFKNAYGSYHDIEVNSSKNVLITNCRFDDSRHSGSNGGESIQLDSLTSRVTYPWGDEGAIDSTPCSNITIENCIFENNPLTGIGHHNTVAVQNITIRNNKIYGNNGKYGISLPANEKTIITGNEIIGFTTRGIDIGTATNVEITNNIVINCAIGFYSSNIMYGIIKGNIFTGTGNTTASQIGLLITNISSVIISNNIIKNFTCACFNTKRSSDYVPCLFTNNTMIDISAASFSYIYGSGIENIYHNIINGDYCAYGTTNTALDPATKTYIDDLMPVSASISSGTINFANYTGTVLFTVSLPVYNGGVS